MTQPVAMPTGGIVVPWDDKQPIAETTWSVKIGVCPGSEHMVFETSYDYGIQEHVTWAEEHWFPISGRMTTTSGPGLIMSEYAGGPAIFRGVIDPGAALRLRIVEGTGFEIPVHVQVGTLSYVGIISTNMPFTFVIDEELTIEDLLSP
jgi:hypothetical protein